MGHHFGPLTPDAAARAPRPPLVDKKIPTAVKLKRLLRSTFHRLDVNIQHLSSEYTTRVVELKARRPARGTVLLSYIIEPFLRHPDDPTFRQHTNFGESRLIAQTYLDKRFDVDVIHFRNPYFIPQKDYTIFVSARSNFDQIAPQLAADCVRIAHLDTAHFLSNNAAAYRRALALRERRGVTCMSVRLVEPNRAIEQADCAAILGGRHSANTYAYAGKPVFHLPIPSVMTYPFPAHKNYNACRRRFLWFGSSGLVHKGLDLMLEAFADMPQYELLVCGAISQDKSFEAVYRRELYELPNIHTLGWLDITTPRFYEVAGSCVALVFPTCCESISASSIACMHAGLIPVIPHEAGIEVSECGVLLRDASSTEEIKQVVHRIAETPVDELESMSRKAWNYARSNHTKERYVEAYRRLVWAVLNE